MAIGEKLWEGRGKSAGQGAIKSVGADGIISEYSWVAEVKGYAKALGLDGSIHVTAIMNAPPNGVSASTDQGTFMTAHGMCVLKGNDLMKMTPEKNPGAVGLWRFITNSEKLDWMNDLVALVVFEALDQMWMESKITIYEWLP